MRDHDMSAREVGDMLGRTPHTIRVWRSKYDERIIPDHALQLLKFKLAERAA
jgi:transposase